MITKKISLALIFFLFALFVFGFYIDENSADINPKKTDNKFNKGFHDKHSGFWPEPNRTGSEVQCEPASPSFFVIRNVMYKIKKNIYKNIFNLFELFDLLCILKTFLL